MLEKLSGIEARYDELNRLLSEVGEDYKTATEYAKERSDIEQIVFKSQEYRKALKKLEEAKDLQFNEDEELRELAVLDISELEPQIELLEKQIKGLIIPKDPRDERNVIVEIRAGTGGDEAALFAADLFRMYTHYAE